MQYRVYCLSADENLIKRCKMLGYQPFKDGNKLIIGAYNSKAEADKNLKYIDNIGYVVGIEMYSAPLKSRYPYY